MIPIHPLNAAAPSFLIDLVSSTVLTDTQFSKAESPIVFTLYGRTIPLLFSRPKFVSAVQSRNAFSPIVVTRLLGAKMTVSSFLSPANALAPIVVK